MKKRLYLTVIAIVLGVALLFGVNYLLSLHKVTFDLKKEVTGATIYRSDKHKIKHIETIGSILLQIGNYYIIPEGKNISQEKIDFTVAKSDSTVTVDPNYTKEYLRQLLSTEKSSIEAAINAKYPTLIGGYTFQQETLYKKGDWSGALLAPKINDPREQKSPYRIVLHKEDGSWEVVRRPEYILTAPKYTDVPIDVLRAVNKLTQ